MTQIVLTFELFNRASQNPLEDTKQLGNIDSGMPIIGILLYSLDLNSPAYRVRFVCIAPLQLSHQYLSTDFGVCNKTEVRAHLLSLL